ncbi:RNA polymerase sigma factor [Cellulomonas iranensis]|uniref:RNA polymerase sigma factor n=1 Tax=Cellulomonas iranensis TaxID=76862 RepID=UPI003D7D53E9
MPAHPQHEPTARPALRAVVTPAGDLDPAADVTRDGAASPAGPAAPRDAPWFEALVRDHATAVHRYLVRRVPASDVEDLAADVLTVAWRRRDDVPEGAELPWLYRTAGFVVSNHRRKGRPAPVADVPEGVDADDPALRAVRDETVRTVLAGLSARDREVILLHAWEGLTGDALAEVLGIGRGGADAALSRARSRLRAALDDAGVD